MGLRKHGRLWLWSGILITFGATLLVVVEERQHADALEQEHRAYQEAWKAGYRLTILPFKHPPSASAAAAMLAITNPMLTRVAGGLGEGVAWMWSTFLVDTNEIDASEVDWEATREALGNTSVLSFETALAVLQNEPRLRFPCLRGYRSLVPHLASLKALASHLLLREGLELHERRPDGAWRMLHALTALATGYEPEPVDTSLRVRAELLQAAHVGLLSYHQHQGLTPAQLDKLLGLWETVDPWSKLPDCLALQRALSLHSLTLERLWPPSWSTPRGIRMIFQDTTQIWSSPARLVSCLKADLWRYRYHRCGTYEDGTKVLIQLCAQERLLSRSIQGQDWPAIQQLGNPSSYGVTGLDPQARLQTIQRLQGLTGRLGSGVPPVDVNDPLLIPPVEVSSLRSLVVAGLRAERLLRVQGCSPLRSTVEDHLPRDFRTGLPFQWIVLSPTQWELRSRILEPDRLDVATSMTVSFPRIHRPPPLVWPIRNAP